MSRALTVDNRDMTGMEDYYLARIEVLEKRITELESDLETLAKDKTEHQKCSIVQSRT